MMAVQHPRLTEKHNSVNISQTGGEICALSLTAWNNRNFGRSFLKQRYQQAEKLARWVLARKDDGCYSARCVAKGFSQIPGKDFQENHAPVISDTMLHLILVIKAVIQLEAVKF
jgi:hypothetical protein